MYIIVQSQYRRGNRGGKTVIFQVYTLLHTTPSLLTLYLSICFLNCMLKTDVCESQLRRQIQKTQNTAITALLLIPIGSIPTQKSFANHNYLPQVVYSNLRPF